MSFSLTPTQFGFSSQTTANQLFNPMLARQQTEADQSIGANEVEMMARASQSLLNPQLYPDEASRAAAYPSVVANLQRQGFARNAPAQYPGDATIRQISLMGTPSQTQAEWSANIAANRALAGNTQPSSTSTAPSVTTPAAPGPIGQDAQTRALAIRDGLIQRGLDPDTATAAAANAVAESGGNPNTPGGGLWQLIGPRAARYQSIFGHPADNAPLGEQLDYLINELNTTEGAARDQIAAAQGPAGKAAAFSQYYERPRDTQGEITRRSALATQLAGAWGPSTTYLGDSLASPGGVGGGAGLGVRGASPAAVLAQLNDPRSPNYVPDAKIKGQNVVLSSGASNSPGDAATLVQQIQALKDRGAANITVLGVGPGVEQKSPGTNAQLKEIAARNGATFVDLPAGQMGPDGVHPTGQGYATLRGQVAPSQPPAAPTPTTPPASPLKPVLVAGPGVPTPTTPTAPAGPTVAPTATSSTAPPPTPANALGPGGGGPAVASTAPAPQPSPGGPQPTGPQLPRLNANGLTDQQQAQLDALGQTGRLTGQQRLAMQTQFQQNNIALQEKLFGEWIQTQQLATSQGQLSVAQANSALDYWKAAHPDAKVTMAGGEIITQDPRTGQEIAPRIQVTPSAAPRSVEGPGVWDGQKWVQPAPGQQGTPGRWTVGPGGGQFFPSQEALVEEQKRDAARLAELRKDTLAQAQGAAQSAALIGNAQQAMNAAMKGNIPPGRFGPELLQITAAAKSLGIDLSPFGVDEKALAAGQVTREQLQQMNGAILRKMFPQRVTNVDLATTGAALPNYGLDPEALAANFKIYQAQADYDQARARDMLDYEAQHGGSLVGWENQWVQKHGFSNGPLDNLFSDAKSGNLAKPADKTPATTQPQYREGQTATGEGGKKIIFRNGNWVPM